MPKAPTLKKAMEKPGEPVLEVARLERVNGRARLPEQLDLYKEPSSMADGRARQMRPSRRKSTVEIRCPHCRSEIRVVEITLTMECPSCRTIVDALEVAPISRLDAAPPPSQSSRSVPAQTDLRLQAAEPILPEPPQSFFIGATGEVSTAQTPTSRRHMVPMGQISLGVTVLLGAVIGVGYWLIYPQQGQSAPEFATPLETPPTVASPTPAPVPPQPPLQLAIGMPWLNSKQPPDEPTILPVADPPVAAPAAEALASVPEALVPQVFATANPVAGPADSVFVVRFDSKLPGLTPSGLRALSAALQAVSKGHKVRIEIAGCEADYVVPKGIDCPALTRGLKSILVRRGVDHPTELIASTHPPTIIFPW
jgi:hypothetical protein